jgi:hypothetical protein
MTPDGPASVDSARIRRWADTINTLAGEGYKLPLSWGHLSTATPHSEDDAQFWAARGNAGKILGAEVDPKTHELIIEGEAPGVEMTADGALVSWAEDAEGRRVRTSIEEVSIGVFDWTDGRGRVWKDAPVHVALTPLPVWVPEGGQPPFEGIDNNPPAGLRFGMGSLLYRFGAAPMADDNDKADDKSKDNKEVDASGSGPTIKKVIEKLRSVGVSLPDDTTPETLLERLYVACEAIKGGDNGGGGTPPPPTPAEADATFMNTIRQNPAAAFLLAKVESDDKARRLGLIASLANRGVPAHKIKELREEAGKLRFALTPTGQAVAQPIDRELAALDMAYPADGNPFTRATVPPPGTAEGTPPEGEDDNGKSKSRALADQLAKAGRLPARK